MFEELVKNGEVNFHSYGRKLEITVEDFGKYNWGLAKNLLQKSGNRIVVSGRGLENYLIEPENLYFIAEFLTQLRSEGANKFPRSSFAVQVNVDISKFDNIYQKPKEEKIVNGLGQVVGDASNWVPEMPYFEKLWNFAVDSAVGGMVGYPGYEHPRDEESFRYRISELVESYMIGTPKQILRYRKYALDSLNNFFILEDKIKKNPNHVFKNPDCLRSLEENLRHARVIAENVMHFSS